MVRSLRFFVVVALAAAVATTAPMGAQGPQQQSPPQAQPQQPADGLPQNPPAGQDPQQPIFRTGINFVRVDVIVSDRNGNPIDNLKPEDFEITEQGKVQKIETFKLIALDGGLIPGPDGPPRTIRTDADEESEAAREDVRLFAIFLDDYHVRRETSMVARTQIARFVETQLGPTDMIGLMYPLEPIVSVRMTRNHDAVMRGLQQFEGRKYDYTPRNDYEQRLIRYPTETVERIRNQISMSAIKSLIVRMGGLKEGRKALILVSEGYSNMVPPQLRDGVAGIPGLGNPNRNNPQAGVNDPLEDRAAFSANADMEADLRDIWDLANKNNVAIYAVDPRGLATGEFSIDQNISNQLDRTYLNASLETLRTLALQTDGRAIVNRNDLTIAMKQIVRDTSSYYLLGYNSTFTATDGKFHEIKVKVTRPGVQVRARKGYWAFTAADAARALAPPKPEPPKAVETALAAITPPTRFRVMRTWIGTERGSDGKTKFTFLWEPVPRVPGDQARNAEAPARVSLTAIAPDGSPYFRGRVPEAAAAAATAPAKVSFEVPPGKMQLRVSVEGASAEVIDSEVREIDVPDLTAAKTTIGTPAVYRGRTLPEFQKLKADPQAVPTASREFTRSDRVFIRVPAYAVGGAEPAVTARLLNRAGQPMSDLTVVAAPGASTVKDIDLSLAPLAPGEYLVEITVAGESDPIKELVGFRMTG